MKRTVFALSALLAATALAFAAAEDDREALMKERGGITGQLVKMSKGEIGFDFAAALTLLQQMQANADKAVLSFDALWPAGGAPGETAPKAWEDLAAFKAANETFKTAVDGVAATPPADLAALQAAVGVIGKGCASCHETYRIKKN